MRKDSTRRIPNCVQIIRILLKRSFDWDPGHPVYRVSPGFFFLDTQIGELSDILQLEHLVAALAMSKRRQPLYYALYRARYVKIAPNNPASWLGS